MNDREPWPKPPPAGAMGEDPVAHLERRRVAAGITQFVTVRIHGEARDGEELLLPLSDIQRVMDRVVRHRAKRWSTMGSPSSVEADMLVTIGASPLPMQMPGGWILIGTMCDPYSSPTWVKVWWNELTDDVKMERPPEPRPIPTREIPPIHYGPAGGVSTQPNVAVAQPGWVFIFEGREYSPAEAERMVTQLGSLDGWTWRHP